MAFGGAVDIPDIHQTLIIGTGERAKVPLASCGKGTGRAAGCCRAMPTTVGNAQ